MNMKKNLINFKLPLHSILYSVICIIFIRYSTDFNTRIYVNSEEKHSESIVTPYVNGAIDSNKLTSTKKSTPPSTNRTTLSRGYTDELDKKPTDIKESSNYEEDSYALNEVALIDSYNAKKSSADLNANVSMEREIVNAHLPDYLMYRNVNITSLKDYLKSRNSLLAEEPYLSTIISISKDFNLNPLVMFAVTGQEQSFVPKSCEDAYEIANNPYNVFNSWKKYNTNIEDTSIIAARTIVNLCKNRPENMDAFTWVNRKYSEDQRWSKAVRSIFEQLESNVPYYK
jgi:hypothetical protein